MTLTRQTRCKLARFLAVAVTGGTLLSSCPTRLKEGIVAGSTDYLYTLLNPTSIVALFTDSSDSGEPDGSP
jgi:hypothetical protein